MPAGMGRHSHPHPHMPGGPVDLGECVLIYKKILEAGGGTWAHNSMHAHSPAPFQTRNPTPQRHTKFIVGLLCCSILNPGNVTRGHPGNEVGAGSRVRMAEG